MSHSFFPIPENSFQSYLSHSRGYTAVLSPPFFIFPEGSFESYSGDGNMSESTMSLSMLEEHHGTSLTCRATNPAIRDSDIRAALTLNILCK